MGCKGELSSHHEKNFELRKKNKMKKEEIEDRLMDALLRGECEEDLSAGLVTERPSSQARLRWGLVGMAASLLLGGVYLASRPSGQGAEDREAVASSLSEERPELLATLDGSYRVSGEGELDVLPADWVAGKPDSTRRPAAPSSATAKVISANTTSPTHIPVPESAPIARVDFGDRDDFGAGWGAIGAGGGGGASFFGRAEPLPGEEGRFRSLSVVPEEQKNLGLEGTGERYGELVDQPWKNPQQEALSTFSVDVDTASYTNIRRKLLEGSPVPKDAVRIEELVNYFHYDYPQPAEGQAFGVGLTLASCPWEPKHQLVRVALQGKEVSAEERGDANLVFLVDVSGSMQDSDKLPLLAESLQLLVEELRENDRVALVVYAGSEGVVLEPTKMGQGGRELVMTALGKLSAGGSTNGGAGIQRAYQLARENFVEGGINRVILATDGDFNVGTTGREALVDLVKKEAEGGVFLSVCGFGRGNLNDAMLEAITNEGNGVYYYIDSRKEGRRVFVEGLMGTLVMIAKDVKLQVEFNPGKVAQYRLIGYANRILRKEDFNNDKVDAGDIGTGHQVTAFYEIIPVGVTGTVRPEVDGLKYGVKEDVMAAENHSKEWLTVKLRHKKRDGEVSELQEFPLESAGMPWTDADADFQFAAGVALWGTALRESEDNLSLALTLAGMGEGDDEQRAEFVAMVKKQLGFSEGVWVLSNATGQTLRFVYGDLKVELRDGEESRVVWTDRYGRGNDDKPMPFSVYRELDGVWRKIHESQLTMTQVSGKALVLCAAEGVLKTELTELR